MTTASMAKLSPAAQTVLDAVTSQTEGGWISPEFIPYEARKIAAALEAVADQVVPEEELLMNARGTRGWHKAIQRADTRSKLLAIAAELRGDTTTETP